MTNNAQSIVDAIRHYFTKGYDVLKPKQIEIVDAIALAYEKGYRAVYIEEPTGIGKTVIASQILRALNGSLFRSQVLIATPTMKLVEDTLKKIKEFAPEVPIGMFYAYVKNDKPVTITTYSSLPQFANSCPDKFDLVILDEAHHILSEKLLAHSKVH